MGLRRQGESGLVPSEQVPTPSFPRLKSRAPSAHEVADDHASQTHPAAAAEVPRLFDTATPATRASVASPRGRPSLKWFLSGASAVLCHGHPRPQGSLEPPRVSGWSQNGHFPVILPYPDTATSATGTSVAGSRVRPSLDRALYGRVTFFCHDHPLHRYISGRFAWQSGQLSAFCHEHPRHRYL